MITERTNSLIAEEVKYSSDVIKTNIKLLKKFLSLSLPENEINKLEIEVFSKINNLVDPENGYKSIYKILNDYTIYD